MLKSMTGFGVASESSKKLQIQVTVKVVNGRFFEFRPHMPRVYQPFESEIKKIVAQTISRGTVDLYVNRRHTDDVASQISVNMAMAKQWNKAYQALAKELKLTSGGVNVATLASQPDVIMVEEISEISPLEKKQLMKTLASALDKVEKERLREGAALGLDIKSYIETLQEHVQELKTWVPQVQKDLEARFRERTEKWQADVDPQRLAQEVAFLIDKSDVSEELARLSEHLKLFLELTQSKQSESQGKKLDFYCQELLREINTIGSKSAQVKLTQVVVNAKSVIERLREQVQNIE